MTQYSFTLPPTCGGIYLLKNPVAKLLYLGETSSLLGRFQSWRPAITGSQPAKSNLLRGVLPTTNVNDWIFLVVEEMPAAAKSDRLTRERHYIHTLLKSVPDGYTVLNTEVIPAQQAASKGAACVPESEVLHQGQPVSYAEAANLLGVQYISISHRLKRLRAMGFRRVPIEILRQLSNGGRYDHYPELYELNGLEVPEPTQPLTRVTYNGETVTYSHAARLLGLKDNTFRTRIGKMRAKGVTEIAVENLMAAE